MGMQASTNSEATGLEPQGLCVSRVGSGFAAADTLQNAVIIAANQSSFIDRWLGSYETFNDAEWDRHSVNMPWVGPVPSSPLLFLLQWSIVVRWKTYGGWIGTRSKVHRRGPGTFQPSILLANVVW